MLILSFSFIFLQHSKDSSKTSSRRELTTNIVKLERFDGGNFRRWQKKIHFLLTTLQVAYVLTSDPPQEHNNETVEQIGVVRTGRMMTTFVVDTYSIACVTHYSTHIKLYHMQRSRGISWKQGT